MNQEYTFTLKYKLPVTAGDIDNIIENLYQNGCDDAIIGVGIAGKIALNFDRTASSAAQAVFSAHKDVLNVIPDAKLVHKKI